MKYTEAIFVQKYRPKTILAQLSDKILRVLVTCGLGISWFVWLWGMSLPSLGAGAALGGLIWLLTRQFSKRSTQKRENQMRRMIGGEMALQRLLLSPPRQAAFQAALWIAPRYPVVMQRAMNWGVEGEYQGQSVLIRLIAQHESLPVSAQQVVEAQRETRSHGLSRCILCLTAPASKDALAYAAAADPPVCIVSRQELIDWAGLCHPATDEDLLRLARRKKTRRSTQEWLAVILDASRARRYFWYGMGMSALALMTGMKAYPLPAFACLALYAGCKVRLFRSHRSAGV